MTLLIAVKSCQRDEDRGCHSIIRNTWGQNIPFNADLRFFMGGQQDVKIFRNDETVLNCPDDYHALPLKTREILKWSVERQYDYTFLCDTDTFIIPEKLIKTDFNKFDYYGVIRKEIGQSFPYQAVDRNKKITRIPECYGWASGGVGYFLSYKAAQYISQQEPYLWAEDLWVGQLMAKKQKDGEFTIGDAKNFECHIAWHFPQGCYKSQYNVAFGWMERMYKEHRDHD